MAVLREVFSTLFFQLSTVILQPNTLKTKLRGAASNTPAESPRVRARGERRKGDSSGDLCANKNSGAVGPRARGRGIQLSIPAERDAHKTTCGRMGK